MVMIHKHKNHITAISFILIVIGFLSGLMGNGEIKNMALIIATVIRRNSHCHKSISSITNESF